MDVSKYFERNTFGFKNTEFLIPKRSELTKTLIPFCSFKIKF